MSIKLTVMVQQLQEKRKQDAERLDKLEKEVNTLRKAVAFLERGPVGESGIRVPQVPLPETLEKLEIGKPSKGT